jgi:thiamine biosynthesis lipoprotein
VQQVVALNDHAMATSGDYRNYYEAEGRRYSHTIDPATGKPITHQLASVTVIADSAMTADALATALNVMGDERGYTFAVEHDMAAYFIYRDAEAFEWRYTPAFSSYLTN